MVTSDDLCRGGVFMAQYCVLLYRNAKTPFWNSVQPAKELFSHLAFALHWQISCLFGLRGEVRAKMFMGALWRNMQKVFPLIYMNFCTSKLWSWKQVISWAPEILKPVFLRMYVFWLGSSLCSNTRVLTEAFPKVITLSSGHPLQSKKLEPTLQLFLSLPEVQ